MLLLKKLFTEGDGYMYVIVIFGLLYLIAVIMKILDPKPSVGEKETNFAISNCRTSKLRGELEESLKLSKSLKETEYIYEKYNKKMDAEVQKLIDSMDVKGYKWD